MGIRNGDKYGPYYLPPMPPFHAGGRHRRFATFIQVSELHKENHPGAARCPLGVRRVYGLFGRDYALGAACIIGDQPRSHFAPQQLDNFTIKEPGRAVGDGGDALPGCFARAG